MKIQTNDQPEAITQVIRDYIAQEIAYDRAHLVLSNQLNLIEQGIIDSMGILRMINFIEEQFGLVLTPNDLLLENFATIKNMTAFILDKLNPA